MNKRVGTIFIKYYPPLGDTVIGTRVEIESVTFSEIDGDTCEAYNRTGVFMRPTPSSLARLMRLMSGKPMLPETETCDWKHIIQEEYPEVWATSCFGGRMTTSRWGRFCPYCGKTIKILDQTPSVKVRHPLDGNIDIYQGFGGKDGKLVRGEHVGLDYIVPVGTPVYVMRDGVVTEAPQDSGTYGRYAMVLHDDGYASLYAHLSKLNVKVGDVVKCGDVIGLSGGAVGSDGAGKTKGRHLHVEVRVKGHLQDNTYNIDPIEYMKSYMV